MKFSHKTRHGIRIDAGTVIFALLVLMFILVVAGVLHPSH